MSRAWLVVALIFAFWTLSFLTMAIADELLKRRHQANLQTGDWTEKVEAMRRMQDEDGAA
jgi:hypothetical protein